MWNPLMAANWQTIHQIFCCIMWLVVLVLVLVIIFSHFHPVPVHGHHPPHVPIRP